MTCDDPPPESVALARMTPLTGSGPEKMKGKDVRRKNSDACWATVPAIPDTGMG